eukprot:s1362_g13.t1
MKDTPWMTQAPTSTLPPLPPPALTEAEERLKAYDQLFQKHKESLPPEFQSDLQSIAKDEKIKATEVETSVLHKQVKTLGYARKELAAANSARLNLHLSWRTLLMDQVQKWQTYSPNFQKQEAAMAQRVQEAVAAVETAKLEFAASKKSLGEASSPAEAHVISDDDMDVKQSSEDSAKQISDSLLQMNNSLESLRADADQAVLAEQQAAKRPRLDTPVPAQGQPAEDKSSFHSAGHA